ncbi:MAG: lysophospholipid acyltransferase family protein [Chloroflexota bacterium]
MIRLGLFAAGVRLAEWLPAPLLYGLARVVGRLLSMLPLASRERLRRNLGQVLGVPPTSPEVRPHVLCAYQTQAANYVDLLRARKIASQDMGRQVVQDGDGWEAFERALAAGRGLVLATAHFGRFELMTHYLGQRGVRLTLPVERLQPPALFDLLCRLRRRPTFTLVAADLGLRPCLRALQRGEAVVLFADWDSTGHGVTVQFCGLPARLPAGPALIAVRAGVPLFVGFNLLGGSGGRLRALIEPPLPVERTGDLEADVQRVTQLMATALERHIRRHPGRWVMFHDLWPEHGWPDHATAMLECGAQTPTGVSA